MNESGKAPQIEVQDIDHLGIVAGIIDAAGVVEEIDRRLGVHPQERFSCGQAVKAMILNGLGFLSAPLYLFEEFVSAGTAIGAVALLKLPFLGCFALSSESNQRPSVSAPMRAGGRPSRAVCGPNYACSLTRGLSFRGHG